MPKGSRGGKRGASGGGGGVKLTPEQEQALDRLIKRTANLKNEQYRIIDADGNVVVEKRGTAHEVGATVGEKRQYLDGNVSLHNHPDGGTFSPDDLSEFGYGAKEIVVATPEGTYRLVNNKYGTYDAKSGWYDMREEIRKIPDTTYSELNRQAKANLENSKTEKQIKAISSKWADIRDKQGNDAAKKYIQSVQGLYDELTKKRSAEIKAEIRRLEVKPFDDFYKANAKKYGFDYSFERNK